MWNSVASKILNGRETQAKALSNQNLVAAFLDRIDTRLEEMIPYSGFSLNLLLISPEVAKRFGETTSNQVRKLHLTWHSHPKENKPKVVQLLHFFSTISYLSMEFNEDERDTFLNEVDLRLLPPQFPRLTTLKFWNWVGQARNPQNRMVEPSPRTFWNEIPLRAPVLGHLHIIEREHRYYMSSSIQQLPEILSYVNPFPCLSLELPLILAENGVSRHPHHLILLRRLTEMGYSGMRKLNLRLDSPTPIVTELFNQFLAMQSNRLESLNLSARATEDPGMHGCLNLPVLPMLSSLHVSLENWPMSHLLPDHVTVDQFPRLTHLTIKIDYIRHDTSRVTILGRMA